jgi:hypothetical protein
MRGRSRFHPEKYRREKMIRLEREVEFLSGERRRLETLLGQALRIAVAGTAVSERSLLNVICEMSRTDPARAAFVDERQGAKTA